MKIRQIITTAVLLLPLAGVQSARVWVEAESFADKGGWVVDQQFIDCMGSPYLMAHGLGTPVADATTEIEVPETGSYGVWVRTYNWTSPWSDTAGPGKFRVKLDGARLAGTVGATGDKWEWQLAGKAKLKAGKHSISLSDLTGFNGRCDAICLTTEAAPVLPDGGDALTAVRRQALGLDKAEPERASYDLVVVGGGIAGMCAAVAAARGGMNVALINDRPVLGGNNSAEVRVHLGGYAEIGPNKGLGRMIREFGHSRPGNAQPAEVYEDDKKQSWIEAEDGVTLYANYRAVALSTADCGRIADVLITHIENGNEMRLSAPLFCDCTGDGTIGYLAGADFRMGREARSEFNESFAPELADSIVMGASVQWYTKKDAKPVRFPEFNYGLAIDDSNCERVTMGEWKWETGMNRNQITEAERVRDYGMLVIFSNWSHLKNHARDNAKFRERSLDWVAYIAGKRESRRLMGDYVLKQDDIDKNVFHEDASFTTSWAIDLHFPDAVNSQRFPGREFKAATVHNWIHPYAVPYRCLYSRNVPNLFMAGRNISVTHVALGTVRVMRTTGMMGEVVGMAAALCKKHGAEPRDIYLSYLPELKEMMQAGAGKDGSTLPDNQKFNLPNKLLDNPKALKESSN